jgi:hypothetical protein
VIARYVGIGGVCTAAMALLKYPAAEVIISSAQRIGQTLAELCQQRRLPTEVHVCGVGVRGDWDQVARPARELRKKGCSIIRQLIKVVKRAVYLDMAIADVIEEERRLGSLEVAAVPADPLAFLPKTAEDIRPLEEARNAYARRALALHRGDVHATARALQITDRTLLARLRERRTERTVRIRKAR